MFITGEKGGVARAKGVEEKEKECTTRAKAKGGWMRRCLLQLKKEGVAKAKA